MWTTGLHSDQSRTSQLGGSGRAQWPGPRCLGPGLIPSPCPEHRSNAQGPTVTIDKAAKTSGDPAPFLHWEAGVITAPSPETGKSQRNEAVQLT